MRVLSSTWFSSFLAAVWVTIPSDVRAETDSGLAFLCPIKVLQDAYAALADPTEALSALAIERHVLAICSESQVKLLEIHENNRRLGELFGLESATVALPVQGQSPEIDTAQVVVQAEEKTDFTLQAIVKRGGETRALIRVDGVGRSVSRGDVLETGHEVVAIGDGVVRLVSASGVPVTVE